MTDKKKIRKMVLAARRAMSPQERETASSALAQRIASSDVYNKAEMILVYKAVPDEADLSFLTELPWSKGKRFCYPRVIEEGQMIALLPSGPDSWEKGHFGIMEPDPEKSVYVSPEDIDLVLCPCTAFSESGERLGMGGGYYDRFLPGCRKAVIAAVAFEKQKVMAVPTEDTDVRMDLVFTESATYSTDMGTGS